MKTMIVHKFAFFITGNTFWRYYIWRTPFTSAQPKGESYFNLFWRRVWIWKKLWSKIP